MCRHLGYLGPPVRVGEILTRGEHSLRSQAWAPREMRGGGTINADGFGAAWWVPAVISAPGGNGLHAAEGSAVPPPSERQAPIDVRSSAAGTPPAGVWPPAEGQTPVEGRVPADVRSPVSRGEARTAGRIDGRAPIELVASRYRSPAPIWTDPAVDEVLPQLRSTAVLAAVRSATVGMPVERAACAPFTDGRWAFSHNGVVQDWRRVLTAVATELGTAELLDAEAHTDSATLWVILRSLLDTAGPTGRSGDGQTGLSPTDPAVALRRLGSAVLARAPRARLNLLLGDGETLWATTVYHSLSVLVTDDVAVLASEPYDDDPRWQAVADGQLVTARPGHLSVVSLVSDESERARS